MPYYAFAKLQAHALHTCEQILRFLFEHSNVLEQQDGMLLMSPNINFFVC
eukprot:c56601_g1_i1 orf=287-436(+)